MCYSKTILKTQATIHPIKTNFLEVLANQGSFMFLESGFHGKKNHKGITTPKESMNKEKSKYKL